MKEYLHHKQGINKTLPKAQRTQGNEYFDSFNTFSSMRIAYAQDSISFEILVELQWGKLTSKGGPIFSIRRLTLMISFVKRMLMMV